MRKVTFNKSPNHMDIDTGHKAFDRHCVCISTCCALGSAQLSGGVRPYNEPKNPIGQPAEPGAMQAYDLNTWLKEAPHYVKKLAAELANQHNGVMLHGFHHHDKKGREVWHGWIIVKDNQILAKVYTGPTHKSVGVIDTVAEYLGDCNKNTKIHFYDQWWSAC